MASKFGDYPEINDTASSQAENIALAGPKKHKEEDTIKIFKSLRKALRKQNKLLKKQQQYIEQQKSTEQQQYIEQRQEDIVKKEKRKNVKRFFEKLGDAVCEAVPDILTTFVAAAVCWLFNTKLKAGKHQTCYAR